jgi:hypothetical protein
MNLYIAQNDFVTNPSIKIAPKDSDVLYSSMMYFDKDGYELNQTEQIYYAANNIDISERHLYHTANHKTWFLDLDNAQSGFVLDHSMLMQRWDYQADSRNQIIRLIDQKPTLGKLLSVRPKWGIDFSLDYVDPAGWSVEIFHIENDFLTLRDAHEAKKRAEDLILNTDWFGVLDEIISKKSEWHDLCSDDQADWKARLVGWHRAFDNQKVFV